MQVYQCEFWFLIPVWCFPGAALSVCRSTFLVQLLKGNALLAWTLYDVRPSVRVPEESSGPIRSKIRMEIPYIV